MDWGDAKKFLFEDILVYAGALVLDVFLDPLINMGRDFNWHFFKNPHELLGHPFHFGVVQTILLIFVVIQLVRKWDVWRYYK